LEGSQTKTFSRDPDLGRAVLEWDSVQAEVGHFDSSRNVVVGVGVDREFFEFAENIPGENVILVVNSAKPLSRSKTD